MCEVDEETARADAQRKMPSGEVLPLKPRWEWESPKDLLKRLEK
jgi:hypothetical protein